MYATKANNQQRPRNVKQFISDQEKYIEYKTMNTKRAQQEQREKEKMT